MENNMLEIIKLTKDQIDQYISRYNKLMNLPNNEAQHNNIYYGVLKPSELISTRFHPKGCDKAIFIFSGSLLINYGQNLDNKIILKKHMILKLPSLTYHKVFNQSKTKSVHGLMITNFDIHDVNNIVMV